MAAAAVLAGARSMTAIAEWAADTPQRVRAALGARRDGELAFYTCFGPVDTSLVGLVRVAGIRWAIEERFQTGKGLVGLDQHQVRQYLAWYRHTTLALLAHAFLVVTRTQATLSNGAKGDAAA